MRHSIRSNQSSSLSSLHNRRYRHRHQRKKSNEILISLLLSSTIIFILSPTTLVITSFLLPTKTTTTNYDRISIPARDKHRRLITLNNVFNEKQRRQHRIIRHYRVPYLTTRYLSLHNTNDDDDDDDDDDYDETPITPATTDKPSFKMPKMHSFGLQGRSPPNQRKAMGRSGSETATVHVCTNCGSEFVKWVGRCPTCKEWNTVQEFVVGRSGISSHRPSFPSSSSSAPASRRKRIDDDENGFDLSSSSSSSWSSSPRSSSSWLNNEDDMAPMRLVDILTSSETDGDKLLLFDEKRLMVPDNQEFNTVMGGGIMPGSLTLLGGDPGVGKSTLLLQLAGAVASQSTPHGGIGMGPSPTTGGSGGPVYYISGEENSWQIASRASRLGIRERELYLSCRTDADGVADMICRLGYDDDYGSMTDNDETNGSSSGLLLPRLIVVDSIQTMTCLAGGSSSPGGVTQVRESVALFLRLAKATSIPIILIGHVTKSGDVAGPKTVEHMVDCVLYLEGDSSDGNVRVLRCTKNRFGSSDDVGVYEMTTGGGNEEGGRSKGGRLRGISDPSSFLLQMRNDETDLEGCAVSLVLEGSRPLMVEVQALVTRSTTYTPRRTVNGLPFSRLLLLLAVLDKRLSLSFSRYDVYINIVGGIRLMTNNAHSHDADVAVAVALASSVTGLAVRADTAFVGEVGLVGELRSSGGGGGGGGSVEKRVSEAKRMGFSRVVVPKVKKRMSRGRSNGGKTRGWQQRKRGVEEVKMMDGMIVLECETLKDAIDAGLVGNLTEALRMRQSRKRQRQRQWRGRRRNQQRKDDESSNDEDMFDNYDNDDEFEDEEFDEDLDADILSHD